MNVTVIPNGPCNCPPGRPPKPPVPPTGDVVHYEDNVTDFITASPDMGIILRTETKVVKLHKGDLVRDLVYVDKNMQLQTITGVLSAVLCKVDDRKSMDKNCPPPPPCIPDAIRPVILVLDVSTEYDASVFKIPISSIRDFANGGVDPADVRVWDIDFISDTQIIFYSKFEPKIVRWNDVEVSFTETRGNVEDATRYLITVDSIKNDNILTVIGTGGAIVTRSVKGIAPELHDTFSMDVVLRKVGELITNYFNVESDDSSITIPQKELYVNLLSHCHGVETIEIVDADDKPVWAYGLNDIIALALSSNSFSTQDLSQQSGSFSNQEIAKQSGDVLMIHAPMLLYLAYQMVTNGYRMLINGFEIDLNIPDDSVWKTPMVASNVLVCDGTDERDSACVCNDAINLTMYSTSCGVSFILSTRDGDKMPEGSHIISAIRVLDEDGAGAIAMLGIDIADDGNLASTDIHFGYNMVSAENPDKNIAYDIIATNFGSVALKINVDVKTE